MGVVFSKLQVSGLLFCPPDAWWWGSVCAPFFKPGALSLPSSGDVVEVTPPAFEGRSQEATAFPPGSASAPGGAPGTQPPDGEEAQLQGEAHEPGRWPS